MRTLLAAFRSALFVVAFYLGSVPIVAAAVVVSWIAPAAVIPVARAWAGWFSLTTRVLLGIRCRVTGTVPATPVLAAFKHQAAYETIMVLALFRAPAVVMKAELTRIPLWSTAARVHGIIPIDRSESTVALRQMLRAANAAKAAGRPVVIFPEGTRTPAGRRPAAQGRTRRTVPRAQAAAGPGRGRFRRVLAEGFRQIPRHRHLRVRRADPAGARPRRHRGAGPCRDQRVEPPMKRIPLWLTIVPLLIGGVVYWHFWSGWRDTLRADLAAVMPGVPVDDRRLSVPARGRHRRAALSRSRVRSG